MNTEKSINEAEGNAVLPHVTCRCGSIIPDENIDKWNGCNEEGEDYGVVTASCNNCCTDYETSRWGEWDDLEDAKSYLQDYINGR